jgi:hypothetical protein
MNKIEPWNIFFAEFVYFDLFGDHGWNIYGTDFLLELRNIKTNGTTSN